MYVHVKQRPDANIVHCQKYERSLSIVTLSPGKNFFFSNFKNAFQTETFLLVSATLKFTQKTVGLSFFVVGGKIFVCG
jgi:hypothetical protein